MKFKLQTTNFKFLLNLLFPKHCISCDQTGTYLCENCTKLIQTKKIQQCYICGQETPSGQTCSHHLQKNPNRLDGLLVAAHYDGNPILKKAIKELKYSKKSEDISEKLGKILQEKLFIHPSFPQGNLILIPVPLHSKRMKKRGFNQSELLCKFLMQETSQRMILNTTNLKRTKQSPPQAQCHSHKERRENLKNSFSCKKLSTEKTYLLVDDICTTGTTLEECCKVMKESGAKSVWGLALARNR